MSRPAQCHSGGHALYVHGEVLRRDVLYRQHVEPGASNLAAQSWKGRGGGSYTAARRSVVLVYFEEYEFMTDAYGREKQLQNWGRKKRVALMEGRIADLVKRMPPDGPDGSVDPAT